MNPKKEMDKSQDPKNSTDAPAPTPGDLNFRSQDFDMESKFSSDHDNNFEYRSEGVPNRKQQFHDYSKPPETKPS